MHLARFRGHACAGGRLRVWPRTKLNKKRTKPKGFAGKKGKPMKKTVKKTLAKKRGTPKKAVPHPRTGPAHRHRSARLTAAPGRPRLQGRDHQPRPAGIHHRLTTTVTTADPRPAPGVTHAAT